MPRTAPTPAPTGPATTAAGPLRTCVGCGARGEPGSMARFVLDEGGGGVRLDPACFGTGPKARGRGAHAHARPSCLRAAAQKGFSRSFRRPVRASAEALSGEVRSHALGRAFAQLRAAFARGLAGEAGGGEALTVVACDCPPEEFGPPLREAVGRGKAVALGLRASLGALGGREALSMVFVRDAIVAEKITRACAVADGAGLGRVVAEVG